MDAHPSPQKPVLLADVEALLMAHHVTPEESLVMKLVGTVGPNGSYVLDRVDVQQLADRVVVGPLVRRQTGDMFTQMLVPLDQNVKLRLPPGHHLVEVRGAQRSLEDSVHVEPEARRPPPETQLHAGPPTVAGAQLVLPVEIVARAGDGFVERVEVRETVGEKVGSWRPAESMMRQEGAVHATATIQRPQNDPERRIEARAVDGQGATDVTPALLVLPKR